MPQVQSALEHKLWFDWLYDRAFYRPSVWLARALYRWFEQPIILGSLREVARRHARSPARWSPASRRACCACMRSRSRAGSPFSSSSSSRCDERLDRDDPDLPPRRGSARLLRLPRGRKRGRIVRRARLARRGRLLDRRGDALRLRARPAVRAAGVVVQRPQRVVPRRHVRLLALARRSQRRRHGRSDRPTRSSRAANDRARTTG